MSVRGAIAIRLLLFDHHSKLHALCRMVLGSPESDCVFGGSGPEVYVERGIVSSQSSREQLGPIEAVFDAR